MMVLSTKHHLLRSQLPLAPSPLETKLSPCAPERPSTQDNTKTMQCFRCIWPLEAVEEQYATLVLDEANHDEVTELSSST